MADNGNGALNYYCRTRKCFRQHVFNSSIRESEACRFGPPPAARAALNSAQLVPTEPAKQTTSALISRFPVALNIKLTPCQPACCAASDSKGPNFNKSSMGEDRNRNDKHSTEWKIPARVENIFHTGRGGIRPAFTHTFLILMRPCPRLYSSLLLFH